MHLRSSIRLVIALLSLSFATIQLHSAAQTAEASSPSAQQPASDPLAIGKQALNHGDYAAAQTFFTNYLQENPNSPDALFFAGSAALGLKRYDEAERLFKATLAQRQTMWSAHKNLVIVYAAQGKWSQFDAERTLLQKARDQGAKGLSPNDADVVDLLIIGQERYIVRAYSTLAGRFKSRYNFTHLGADGKLDFWIACESDDIDQIAYAKAHPEEAAAGKRSFSLDSYTVATPNADGKTASQTHGTLKFYPEGEPAYETVRADVLKTLQTKSGPMSSTTVNQPTSPSPK